ncbi:MAG: hypothetical protein BWY82_02870 [Verrucomicrobia bacterium ADurb.Bin474]|nr:MAG: hypothetical protein BWY82_02870 [Verrucomicrobia bacterium ADurb.Bin474]
MKDAEAIGERYAMEADRTAIAQAHPQSQRRAAARSGPSGIGRDHLRAEDGDTVGGFAPGNGVRQRNDLLEAVAGVERIGCMGSGAAGDMAGIVNTADELDTMDGTVGHPGINL